MSNPMIIRPEIRDGKIVTIEIGYESLPLKKPIPLSEFSELMQLLEKLSEYIDFGGQSGWSFPEIDGLIWGEISEMAHDFFRVLAIDGDWVKREIALTKLHISGRVLAGALSSPGQFFSRYKKDPIYEKVSRLEQGKENLYYRIKTDYLTLVRMSYEIKDSSLQEDEHINVLINDDFEKDIVGFKPINWETIENEGSVVIIDEKPNIDEYFKFVEISSPSGSKETISKSFNEKDSINLTYFLRQEKYGQSGVGAGFHLFYNNKEAIWFGITNKMLSYYDNKYHDIVPIELGVWYKIQIKADCVTNSFSCIVNDKLSIKKGSFRNKVPFINRISSSVWVDQDNWATSFNKIKLVEFK